jgi:predicted DNA binding CopG/RHH family protein
MTDKTVRARRDAIRAEYAAEEAEAAEAEAVEAEQAVLSVRVSAQLAETLKARAAAEHIPVSALVRRLLSHGILETDASSSKPALADQPTAVTGPHRA